MLNPELYNGNCVAKLIHLTRLVKSFGRKLCKNLLTEQGKRVNKCKHVICMLHVCYMFGQHITCFNPFVHRHLSHIMLYGYMFFENSI